MRTFLPTTTESDRGEEEEGREEEKRRSMRTVDGASWVDWSDVGKGNR
jgi:hypothetical protein